MKHFLFLVLLCNLFLFNSCKKYQPAPAAFFIKPNVVTVASTGSLQGTSNHKITELYLYVNGKFQGAYQNGNLLPIVSNGERVTIDIFAGIKNNGIQTLSIPWLLYEKITFDTLVESGKTIERALTFKYNPNTKFIWLENFDNPIGFSLVKETDSYLKNDTMFKIASPGDSFEGKSIEIGDTTPLGEASFESSVFYPLPIGNTHVYLEINYKGNQQFEVGLIDGFNAPKPALMVNPKEEWNKIYIHLSDAVSREPAASKYKVYFKMLKPNDNPTPRVWLDNIKLIYL